MLRTLKLIIFDLDDTLICSNIDYYEIKCSIAELFSPPLSEETIKTTPILKLLKRLKQKHPDKYDEGKTRLVELEKKAADFATVLKGAEKIHSLLTDLHIQAAIFTNNSVDTLNLYLKKPHFNFLTKFTIFTREDFIHPKPDPEGIIKIIEKHEVPPDSVIYVGDSYIDAIAAQKSGVRFIHFKSRETNQKLFPEPPYATITNWDEFEDLLNQNLGNAASNGL